MPSSAARDGSVDVWRMADSHQPAFLQSGHNICPVVAERKRGRHSAGSSNPPSAQASVTVEPAEPSRHASCLTYPQTFAMRQASVDGVEDLGLIHVSQHVELAWLLRQTRDTEDEG